jgi:hypothetical protein
MSNDDSITSYSPVFLHPDETGPTEITRSINQPVADREIKPSPENYIEYQADLKDLRLLTPYMEELKKRLGESCYVIQFKTHFTLDSVPNEFKQKDRPLLWKVKTPNSVGWVTDQDQKTFYFPSQKRAVAFLEEMRGDTTPAPLADELEKRDNLNKLLWE